MGAKYGPVLRDKGIFNVKIHGIYFMSFITALLSIRSIFCLLPVIVTFEKIEATKKDPQVWRTQEQCITVVIILNINGDTHCFSSKLRHN